jgi:hypothetical protein
MHAFIEQGRNINKQIYKDMCFKNHMQLQYITMPQLKMCWVCTVTQVSVTTETMNSESYTPFTLVHFSGNKQKRTQLNILVYFMQYNIILHTVKLYLVALEEFISLIMSYGLWCYEEIIVCGVYYRYNSRGKSTFIAKTEREYLKRS